MADEGTDFGRQPPQDLNAERSVLGAAMLSKDAIADIVEELRPGDFYKPAHQSIWDAILDLYGNGEPADAVTVAAALERRGDLTRVGGAPELHTLIQMVPTAANASYYARIVAEKAVLRRLVEAGTRIVQYGYAGADTDADVADVVDRAQADLYEVTGEDQHTSAETLDALMQPTLDELDALAAGGGLAAGGVPSGFLDLDDILQGAQPGQLIVVAGRPGSGKSTMAIDWARSAAIKHDMPTAVFSLEMSKTELTMRILSAETRIPLAKMRSGKMDDTDWARLATRMGEISAAPLFLDDSPNLTMMEIRAKARRLTQRHGLKLIVVDYLQLMTSGKRTESRQQEVSDLSRALKLLAKELGVPIIALSQLNRGPEQRVDRMPQISDLRDSGSIEQDCDIAILIHRPDAYDRDSPRAGEADFVLAKHRNGKCATLTVAHQLHCCRFVDMARG